MVMRRVQRRALNVVTNATKHLNAQCETNGTRKSQEGRKLARRDLETHPPYHCVPDDSNDLDTSLEHCASQSGELVHDSNLQMAQELGDYMAAVASLYHISHHRMPPLLQVSRQCGFDVAACALPDCQADGKLNLNKFWVAGYSTSSRLRNRVNRNPSWNLPQFLYYK